MVTTTQPTPKVAAAAATLPLAVRDAHKRYGAVEALAGAGFEVRPRRAPRPAGTERRRQDDADQGHRRPAWLSTPARFSCSGGRCGSRSAAGARRRAAGARALSPAHRAREPRGLRRAATASLASSLRDGSTWALELDGLADRANEPVEAILRRHEAAAQHRLRRAAPAALVLLDEPTVGVDPQSRERIYEMLAELRADGVSLLLTTHHLEEAEARCERDRDHRPRPHHRGRHASASWSSRPWAPAGRCASRSAVRIAADVALPRRRHARRCRAATRACHCGPSRRDVASALAVLAPCWRRRRGPRRHAARRCSDVFIHLTGRELRDDGDRCR